jgi:hypothetical protein
MMLRDFVDSLKPRPQPLDAAHVLPFLGIIAVVFGFYYSSMVFKPGWVTYWLSAINLFLMLITAWARLNDIGSHQISFRYQVRKLGLILVIAACCGMLVKPWVARVMDWPSWNEVMLRCGVNFVWMTTPMMPPWNRYIRGKFRRQTIEVPSNVEVNIVRTDTIAGGGMFQERRRSTDHIEEDGP